MRSRILLVVTSCVLLAACSSGGDDPETEPDQQHSASPSGSTAADLPSVDVCDLIDEDLLAQVTTDGDTPRTVLGYGTENFAMCSVNDYVQFQFGFRISPGGPGMPEVSDTATPVDGLGDVSVQDVGGYGSASLWTEQDGILFTVRNDTVGNADGIPAEQNEAVMRALIANVTPEVVEQVAPIELGELCPAADDPAVTDVAGTVVTARGGNVYGGEPADCQYLGGGGTRINLGYVAQDGASADFVSQSGETDEQVDMDGAEHAVVDNSSPGSVNLKWSTGPDLAWLADVTPLVGFPDYENESGAATTDNVMALGRAFMSVNPDAGDD